MCHGDHPSAVVLLYSIGCVRLIKWHICASHHVKLLLKLQESVVVLLKFFFISEKPILNLVHQCVNGDVWYVNVTQCAIAYLFLCSFFPVLLTNILVIWYFDMHKFNGLFRMHFSILWSMILSRKPYWLTRVKYILDHDIRQNQCQCLLQVNF